MHNKIGFSINTCDNNYISCNINENYSRSFQFIENLLTILEKHWFVPHLLCKIALDYSLRKIFVLLLPGKD